MECNINRNISLSVSRFKSYVLFDAIEKLLYFPLCNVFFFFHSFFGTKNIGISFFLNRSQNELNTIHFTYRDWLKSICLLWLCFVCILVQFHSGRLNWKEREKKNQKASVKRSLYNAHTINEFWEPRKKKSKQKKKTNELQYFTWLPPGEFQFK